jgi:hypothetical protein
VTRQKLTCHFACTTFKVRTDIRIGKAVAIMNDGLPLQQMIAPDGTVMADDLAQVLCTSKPDLAAVLGLPLNALSANTLSTAEGTHRTLRDLIDVLTSMSRWTESPPQAFAWFSTEPLPSFGDQTCAALMREGRASAVKSYVSRIAVGGYA